MSKRSRLWLYITGAVCAVGLVAWLGQRLSVSYRTPLTDCIVDPGTGGGLGLSRWAERLGYRVRAVDVPLWEAPRELGPGTGNCVLSAGNDSSPGHEEEEPAKAHWDAVRHWIGRGNALVLVTTAWGSLPEFVREEINGTTSGSPSRSQDDFTSWLDAVPADPDTVQVPVKDGGHLFVMADAPRWQPPEKDPDRKADADRPRVSELAADSKGAVLLRVPIDEGAVYVLLDEFAWTNAGLDHGDNARVLARILEREVRGGVFGLDEFRHGHGRAESFLSFLLSFPGAGAALAIGALWGAFFVYGRNVRLRPAEDYSPGERRTSKEYVDAVAQLHERARAAPLAVEAVARRLRHLSRGGVRSTSEADSLLRRAEELAAEGQRPRQAGEARKLMIELVRVRKQIYGSRTIS